MVVQAVLLFGAETWVITPRIEKALESFMHRAARRITGNETRIRGWWEMDIFPSEGSYERGGG